ncbi:MAG: FkbM family methyltransferase [Pseudomonadota bacterium]
MNIALVISFLALAAAVAACYYALKAKRWLWAELLALKQAHQSMQNDLVLARKKILLAALRTELRLPAKLPSQHGEEILIHEFFGGKLDGFFVEIGAYDGVGFSNTYFLEALGWDGLLIEADPAQAKACRDARPFSRVMNVACGKRGGGTVRFKSVRGGLGLGTLGYMGDDPVHRARIEREGGHVEEIEVELLSLDDIMAGKDRHIDVLSIDVEGAELDVLQGTSLDRLRPTLILLEDNSGGRNRTVFDLLNANGYRQAFVWYHNVFFVRNEDARNIKW